MEPDWQTFGKDEATAMANLLQLAEQLGCRDCLPRVLREPELMSLARGTPAILVAIKAAGGAAAVLAADRDAALCLCRGLMQRPGEMCSSVEDVFAGWGPALLHDVAGKAQDDIPGFLAHVHAAGRLLAVFQEQCEVADQQQARQQALQPEIMWQEVASDYIIVLCKVVDELFDWSTAVGRAAQQRRQPLTNTQRPAQLVGTASQLHEHAVWLPQAAGSLLRCVRGKQFCSAIDKQKLLDTLGQLLQRVVTCVEQNERLAALGLWPPDFSLSATVCVGQLFSGVLVTAASMDQPARAAARLPALQVPATRALSIALDHLTAPRHLGLLLYLSKIARLPLLGAPHYKGYSIMMGQFTRVQQLTVTWYGNPEAVPAAELAGHLPGFHQLHSSADQVALLLDNNATQLADVVHYISTVIILTYGEVNTDSIFHSIFHSGAVEALAATLQVDPCRNVRGLAGDLVEASISSCLAPGLFRAAEVLQAVTQRAVTAAAAGKPWAGAAVASLVRGGLGSLRLGHAEAAAQAAPRTTAPGAQPPDPRLPQTAWQRGAEVLANLAHSLTPLLARTLAKRGLVGPLLQALPMRATTSEAAAEITAWQASMAIGDILAAVLAADPSVCTALLRDGSWDAAVKRLRDLQAPLPLAPGWLEQRDALLHRLALLNGGSGSSSEAAGGSASAADADAVAAAERAMQELLAEEQPARIPGKGSRAAVKRARKEAAKQQAPATGPDAQSAALTAEPVAGSSSTGAASRGLAGAASGMPTAGGTQSKAALPVRDTAYSMHGSPGAPNELAQQTESDASNAAAQGDWWRCSLSGVVMRDPVLCGSGGHSFEREALEDWLAANPGLDPTSRQPLPPEGSDVLPNHALRNMIQQLRLS